MKESHSAAGRKTETIHEQDGGNFDVIRESFCHCYFFAKECLSPQETGSACLCKHILAVKIAEALAQDTVATVVVKEIEDRDFAPLMLQSRAYLSKYEESKFFAEHMLLLENPDDHIYLAIVRKKWLIISGKDVR